MTQKYIIGNWKLNPATHAEAIALSLNINKKLSDVHHDEKNTCKIGVTPCFLHLGSVRELTNSSVAVGTQDISHKTTTTGAFTGDVSAHQVADLGATFTLIGHSERRQYHGESNDDLIEKIQHAFDADLSVIFCIGESKDEYENGQTLTVLEEQLAILAQFSQEIPVLEDTPKNKLPKLLIAYEPVWAIGTGLTPTPKEVNDIHNFISEMLSTMQISAPILYGGSVNDKNVQEFAKLPMVDGVLVGGASLNADSFETIILAFTQ